jgi:hypothetical protein
MYYSCDPVDIPHAMTTFLCTSLLDNPNPKLLLNDEKFLMLEDNSLKLALLKMIETLILIRNWVHKNDDDSDNLQKVVENSLAILNIFRDSYIWEHVNIGHWKSVKCGWRRAYTFLCICKVLNS